MLGDELRKARLAAALTQEQVAERSGLTREYVSQLELDKRIPSLPVLVRLCRTMGITTLELAKMIDRVEWPAPSVSTRPK